MCWIQIVGVLISQVENLTNLENFQIAFGTKKSHDLTYRVSNGAHIVLNDHGRLFGAP